MTECRVDDWAYFTHCSSNCLFCSSHASRSASNALNFSSSSFSCCSRFFFICSERRWSCSKRKHHSPSSVVQLQITAPHLWVDFTIKSVYINTSAILNIWNEINTRLCNSLRNAFYRMLNLQFVQGQCRHAPVLDNNSLTTQLRKKPLIDIRSRTLRTSPFNETAVRSHTLKSL